MADRAVTISPPYYDQASIDRRAAPPTPWGWTWDWPYWLVQLPKWEYKTLPLRPM